MEGIINLHHDIMYYCVVIFIFVVWFIWKTMLLFRESSGISRKDAPGASWRAAPPARHAPQRGGLPGTRNRGIVGRRADRPVYPPGTRREIPTRSKKATPISQSLRRLRWPFKT